MLTWQLPQTWLDYWIIVRRNVFSIVSMVIGSVIALLIAFGEQRDAIFLASILVVNCTVGVIQEVRAKRALDKLKALIAQTARRLTDIKTGEFEEIAVNRLDINDVILLQRGDQIPADGKILNSQGFEVNEAFLTGESRSIAKPSASQALAGSFVVAGQATMRITAVRQQTKIEDMTGRLKHYQSRLTPIQRALARLLTIFTYILLVAGLALFIRQWLLGGSPVELITQIAAVTGTIVPEGLILASTALFAYGAIQMYQRRVLLQQINAIESLARIEWLFLDKTGTLTENHLRVGQYLPHPQYSQKQLQTALETYLAIAEPDGELAAAVITSPTRPAGEITTGFSSERKYGSVRSGQQGITVGAPDQLLQRLKPAERQWVSQHNLELAAHGDRIIFVGLTSNRRLRPLGLVAFSQPIKSSSQATLRFFQRRGVKIRIISGDQPTTVRAVAEDLDLIAADEQVVTGQALSRLKPEGYREAIQNCPVFARVSPQQKAEIIRVARSLGYTAMVGDGANDALALKQADIGISMFQAADITRTVADIVLLDDEFRDIPAGVRLADNIITSLELIGCLFLNKVVIGFTLLLITFTTHTSFPLSPRNITVLNYFIIGLPVLIWTFFPRERRRLAREASYLRRIMPVVILNGGLTIIATSLCFWLASIWQLDTSMAVFLSSLLVGLGLLYSLPRAFQAKIDTSYLRLIAICSGLGLVGLAIIFVVPPLRLFFGLEPIQISWIATATIVAGLTFWAQLIVLNPKWIEGWQARFRGHTK